MTDTPAIAAIRAALKDVTMESWVASELDIRTQYGHAIALCARRKIATYIEATDPQEVTLLLAALDAKTARVAELEKPPARRSMMRR